MHSDLMKLFFFKLRISVWVVFVSDTLHISGCSVIVMVIGKSIRAWCDEFIRVLICTNSSELIFVKSGS